jgi:diguanylate cyclase (GGDEF)-like protein
MVELLNKTPKVIILIISIFLVIVIGYTDFLTGYEFAWSIFYFIPIYFSAWYGKKSISILIAILSGISWLIADIYSGHPYSNIIIPYFNGLVRTTTFLLFALLFSKIKEISQKEKELARRDFLTGLLNSRGFYEYLNNEIERFKRYKSPFTIVYMDIDNFKQLNDNIGHLKADEIIREIAREIRNHFHSADIIARLGGDEFCFLLVETDYQKAKLAMDKLKDKLLSFVSDKNLPITFSYGAATFENDLSIKNLTPEEVVKIADDLMYESKKNGKNKITHKVY